MRVKAFTLSSVTFGVGILAACTHDFGTFEGTAAEGGASTSTSTSSSSSSTSTSSGGTTTSSSSGTTTSSGGSSGTSSGVDANVDCQAVSGSCYTQDTTCKAKCKTDYDACAGVCPTGGQGNKCRNDCANTQATCEGSCKTTCQMCAGPQCASGCT